MGKSFVLIEAEIKCFWAGKSVGNEDNYESIDCMWLLITIAET